MTGARDIRAHTVIAPGPTRAGLLAFLGGDGVNELLDFVGRRRDAEAAPRARRATFIARPLCRRLRLVLFAFPAGPSERTRARAPFG